jgi:hypothetical protein
VNLTGAHTQHGFHLALELDPAWNRGLPPDFVFRLGHESSRAIHNFARPIFDAAIQMGKYTRYVWFIDYQIRRKLPEDVVAGQYQRYDEPYVFYAHDRKFTEVIKYGERDPEEWSRNGEFPQDEPGSSHQFLRALVGEQIGRVDWAVNAFRGEDAHRPRVNFGLLASEYL